MDLHVHSPASTDYSGDKDASAYEFMSAFVARGFDLIAITDHNTGAYLDQAIEARNRIAREEGKNITVLPGVELYVSPGVHLLAILPEGGSAAISDLLSRLELPPDQHGDTTKHITLSIDDVVRIVHERRGLLVGAHCNSTHGVVDKLDGQPRLEWLSVLDALEIKSGQEEEKISKTIDFVTNSLGVSIPFTFGSDSHNAASETTGMWVKMAEPSFTSLRQLTFEPELRISRTEPVVPAHGRIVGFTTTHGIYPDERFRFSPHLNVLLGGRGAGKSAAIDLLRFAFEAEPRAGDDNNGVFSNRIMEFLQSVGEVLVVVVGSDGETYAVIRSGVYDKPSARATPVFSESARVYQVAGNDLIQREKRPLDVLGIEFYGQGEVARLADRVDEQLRLIDENLDHSDAAVAISEIERKLKTGEEQLVELKRCLEKLGIEAAKRPQLEASLCHLTQSLAAPIFQERTRWDREHEWVQEQQDWVERAMDSLPVTIPARTSVNIDIEGSPVKAILEKVRNASDRILKSAQTDLDRSRQNLQNVLAELEGHRAEWDTAFKLADEEYRARLAELGATNLADAAVEQRRVEQELAHIENSVEPEVKRVKSKIASIETCRSTLLTKLKDARSAIADLRSEFVEELSLNLGCKVVVDVSGSDTSLYFDAINSPLRGSGMQRREDQLSLVCESFTPEKLAEIIRAGTVEQLTAIGVTENNASRMLKTLADDVLSEGVLHKIERVDIPQLPSIRIQREGETTFTDLSSLSVGEKCSAILSIALLSKRRPLVIDQPEDDLDHAFIINSIVEGVRNAKTGRQIIAATHNPNIPVLGDAEMVYRVARRAGQDICQIKNSGGLELPQVTAEVQSLEGGAEAFERRRQRYSGVP